MRISQSAFIGQLENDHKESDWLTSFLRVQLYKLDAVAEDLSPGFIERKLQKFSHATGHYGFIDLNGEFIEYTSYGRRISNPQEAHNPFVQTATQPPRSLDDVRTVVANGLRRFVFLGLHSTDAAARARGFLTNIRTNQTLLEGDHSNISLECTERLRELAKIEAADALEEYLESLNTRISHI